MRTGPWVFPGLTRHQAPFPSRPTVCVPKEQSRFQIMRRCESAPGQPLGGERPLIGLKRWNDRCHLLWWLRPAVLMRALRLCDGHVAGPNHDTASLSGGHQPGGLLSSRKTTHSCPGQVTLKPDLWAARGSSLRSEPTRSGPRLSSSEEITGPEM